MAKYNILPLALGTDYHVLAKQSGLLIPPLRRADEYGGRLEVVAALHGSPWLARVDVGALHTEAGLSCSGWFRGIFLDVGRFDTSATLSGDTPTLAIPDASLSMSAALSADPLRAYPMGRFGAGADLTTSGTYLGMYQEAGRFDLSASLPGMFKRLVWWLDAQPVTSQRVYICTLTGATDGTTDLTLPISSFQFRLYDNGGSYLSVVVPNATKYAADISARINGQIVIRQGYRYGDGTEQTTEMARAGQIGIRSDTGPRSSSTTITAGESVTFSFDPGVEKRITKLMVRTLQADGNTMLRAAPIFGLFPGDTVHYQSESWTVQRISVAVGRNLQTMDILV